MQSAPPQVPVRRLVRIELRVSADGRAWRDSLSARRSAPCSARLRSPRTWRWDRMPERPHKQAPNCRPPSMFMMQPGAMEQRDDRGPAVRPPSEAEAYRRLPGVHHHGAMGQHRALGRAGRAGGVEQGRPGVGIGRGQGAASDVSPAAIQVGVPCIDRARGRRYVQDPARFRVLPPHGLEIGVRRETRVTANSAFARD